MVLINFLFPRFALERMLFVSMSIYITYIEANWVGMGAVYWVRGGSMEYENASNSERLLSGCAGFFALLSLLFLFMNTVFS